jgi:hypothetical protein
MFRRAATISVCLAVSLALAACGSSSPGTSAAKLKADAFLSFARCMRANGVSSFPDPGGATGGGLRIQAFPSAGASPQSLTVNGTPVNAPAFRSAMSKCQGKLPHFGRPSAQQLARMRKGALAMARCMRAHGIPNFPDPQFRSGPGGRLGIAIGPGSGVDPSSPAFQAAARACQKTGLFKEVRAAP